MPDSAPDSGAIYRTESRRRSPRTSERDYLTDRATDAGAAIGRRLGDMKDTLKEMAGLRSCAERHPWILIGLAVAAGVVAGAALTPASRARIRRTQKTPSIPAAEAQPARQERELPRKPKSLLLSIAGTALAAVLQPLVQSWFATAVATQDESPNGPSSSGDSAGADASESGVDRNA